MRTSRILPVSAQPPSTSKSFLANGRVQYRTLYDDGSSVPQNPATVAAGRQQIRRWEIDGLCKIHSWDRRLTVCKIQSYTRVESDGYVWM